MVKFLALPTLLLILAVLFYFYSNEIKSFVGKYWKLITWFVLIFAIGATMVISTRGFNFSFI